MNTTDTVAITRRRASTIYRFVTRTGRHARVIRYDNPGGEHVYDESILDFDVERDQAFTITVERDGHGHALDGFVSLGESRTLRGRQVGEVDA